MAWRNCVRARNQACRCPGMAQSAGSDTRTPSVGSGTSDVLTGQLRTPAAPENEGDTKQMHRGLVSRLWSPLRYCLTVPPGEVFSVALAADPSAYGAEALQGDQRLDHIRQAEGSVADEDPAIVSRAGVLRHPQHGFG